jgi:1-acyl-sn-glycerol-3-phosphate acyltransferase
VTIFPEGTTSDGTGLLPFKGSLLAVLEPPPPGVLVQPVHMDYGAATEAIAWVGDEPGQANALKVMARRGGFAVTLHFLDPFDPRDFPGRKGIAAEARRRIAEAMGIDPAA